MRGKEWPLFPAPHSTPRQQGAPLLAGFARSGDFRLSGRARSMWGQPPGLSSGPGLSSRRLVRLDRHPERSRWESAASPPAQPKDPYDLNLCQKGSGSSPDRAGWPIQTSFAPRFVGFEAWARCRRSLEILKFGFTLMSRRFKSSAAISTNTQPSKTTKAGAATIMSAQGKSQRWAASERDLRSSPTLGLNHSLRSTCRDFRKCMYNSVGQLFLQEHC